jgi:hypothetical protein
VAKIRPEQGAERALDNPDDAENAAGGRRLTVTAGLQFRANRLSFVLKLLSPFAASGALSDRA